VICVITPYVNEPASWIWHCVDSVRAQSTPAVHILVADGVDRPEIAAIDGIVHLRSATNLGPAGARGLGCRHALTEGATALAFLDADDIWHREHLTMVSSATEATRCDVAVSVLRLGMLPCGNYFVKLPSATFTSDNVAASALPKLEPDQPGQPGMASSSLFLRGGALESVSALENMPAEITAFEDMFFAHVLFSKAPGVCWYLQPTVAVRLKRNDVLKELMPRPDLARQLGLEESTSSRGDAIQRTCDWWHGLEERERQAVWGRLGRGEVNWFRREELAAAGLKPRAGDMIAWRGGASYDVTRVADASDTWREGVKTVEVTGLSGFPAMPMDASIAS
jgi:hypothetical protein